MSAYTEIPKIKAENGELPPKVLAHLDSRYPSGTANTVTYYVSPLGDDTYPGTDEYPLATIAAATSRIPEVVRRGHTYRIVLKPGEYAEPITISGVTVDGHISIETETNDHTLYKVENVYINNVQGSLTLRDITATIQGDGTRSFEFRASGPLMQIINCATTPDNDDGSFAARSRGLLADFGSIVRAVDNDLSGKRYGMRSNYNSQIHSLRNTGTGNDIGVGARFGGKASGNYADFPSGNVPYSTNSGGIITSGHGGIIGQGFTDERGLLTTENYRDTGVSAKTWKFDSDAAYQLPEGPIPRNSEISFRFRAPKNDIAMTIRTSWIARNTTSSHQGIDTVHHVFFRGNEITGSGTPISLYGRDITDDSVTITARGSNLDFYVNIAGVQAMADEWTARVTIEANTTDMPSFAGPSLTS